MITNPKLWVDYKIPYVKEKESLGFPPIIWTLSKWVRGQRPKCLSVRTYFITRKMYRSRVNFF